MQIYDVPYNFNHEEKVFGGYLSLRQAIYLVLVIALASIFMLPILDILTKSLIFIIVESILITFAFVKIDENSADKYFLSIIKFLFRKKRYY